MAEIPDVVIGEIIETDWGNDIRDRTIQRYADEAERDNLNPTPAKGDVAWLDDSSAVTWYNGSGWTSVFLLLTGGTVSGVVRLTYSAVNPLRFERHDAPGMLWEQGTNAGGQFALRSDQPRFVVDIDAAGMHLRSGYAESIAQIHAPAFYAALGTDDVPAYSYVGDENTGVFSPGNGKIALSCNGVVAVDVSSTGMTVPGYVAAFPGLSDTVNAANVYRDATTGRLYASTAATATEDYVNAKIAALEARITQLETQSGP